MIRLLKRLFWYTLLLMALVTAGFCIYVYNLGKVHISTEPNKDHTFYHPDTSVLRVPVSLSVKDIEELANTKLKPGLLNGKFPVRRAKDTLHLNIDRAGPVRFRLLNNVLRAYVPLKAEAFYSLRTLGKKNATFFRQSPVVFSFSIILETPVVLNRHYGFDPSTKLESIEWNETPVVKLGPVKKDISREAEALLFKKEKEITAKLDSVLRTKISLRQPMEKVWEKLQRAVPLRMYRNNLVLYLYEKPLQAAVWPEPGNSDSMHFTLQLKSLLYILQARDTLRFKKAPLPRTLPVLPAPPRDDSTRFHVQVALPLRLMEDICNKKLAGKKLAYAGYRVRLKKARIFNGPRHVMIRLRYRGDFSGEVKMKGVPEFNVKEKTFCIRQLEYESSESNVVLESAEKFFHDDILQKMRESARIDMRHMLNTLPDLIQDGINRSRLSAKARIMLQDFEIERVTTRLTVQYVQLMLSGRARIHMHLKKKAIIKTKTGS